MPQISTLAHSFCQNNSLIADVQLTLLGYNKNISEYLAHLLLYTVQRLARSLRSLDNEYTKAELWFGLFLFLFIRLLYNLEATGTQARTLG
jgi:hypothetical protein